MLTIRHNSNGRRPVLSLRQIKVRNQSCDRVLVSCTREGEVAVGKNDFETVVDAFEDRMALRKTMLQVTGVRLGKMRSAPQDLEDSIRVSIITCYECQSGENCRAWLAIATQGMSAPEFCPNQDTIKHLNATGYTHEDPV